VGGSKRDRSVSRISANRGQRSYIILGRHTAIQVKSSPESKPDHSNAKPGFIEKRSGQPLSFPVLSHDAVIRVYDESGNVIQTHEHTGDFKEW
jgi:hypothetical protein